MEPQLSVRVECPRPAREGLPPPSLHTISAIIPYLQYDCIVFYPFCHHFIRGLLLYQHRNYQRHHPPPSQTKCNHPSSISSSLHLFRQVLIYPPLPPCFIHPGLRFTLICGLKGPRLATAPLRAGLINYPPSAAC